MGAVVMPHNLYLHSATIQERKIDRGHPTALKTAVRYCSWEPAFPIFVSFFINMAVVSIAAQTIYGVQPPAIADTVGLTNICTFFKSLGNAGCILWGIALISAGQSSAITTTYTGQYVMEGFLKLNIGLQFRAVMVRVITIIPCVIVAAVFPDGTALNTMVNYVNTALSILLVSSQIYTNIHTDKFCFVFFVLPYFLVLFLLLFAQPFALFPLIKYNCNESCIGEHAFTGWKKWALYVIATLVWFVNAMTLSYPGGGCFGDLVQQSVGGERVFLIIIEVVVQIFYAVWLFWNLFSPYKQDDPEIEW